jgi:hypothetical protein
MFSDEYIEKEENMKLFEVFINVLSNGKGAYTNWQRFSARPVTLT